MSNKLDEGKYAMTYRQIAETLTAQEGVLYTEEQVRKICSRALVKLREQGKLKEFLTSLSGND